MFPSIYRNSLTRTYLYIRHGKIVPNTRAIFCTFCKRPQSDIHFSISFVNYSVCFSGNIKNFLFPPGWAFYNYATSIFFKGNFTLITKILAWTCRRLILRGKYIYASFTKTLAVQIQASNRNSDSKLDGNGVSFFDSVWKRWGLEISESKIIFTFITLIYTSTVNAMKCTKLNIYLYSIYLVMVTPISHSTKKIGIRKFLSLSRLNSARLLKFTQIIVFVLNYVALIYLRPTKIEYINVFKKGLKFCNYLYKVPRIFITSSICFVSLIS